MSERRAVRIALAVLATCALAACTSPEATRVRGDGPGADVGNRGAVVEMHAGAKPYYKTPCAVSGERCTGPMPVFGTRPSRD